MYFLVVLFFQQIVQKYSSRNMEKHFFARQLCVFSLKNYNESMKVYRKGIYFYFTLFTYVFKLTCINLNMSIKMSYVCIAAIPEEI